MQRKSFSSMECTIARSLEQLGDAWSLLILRTALLGVSRFQDFQERLEIPPTTLTRRLEALTEQGFFTRTLYEQRPPREAYALTEKGRDVLPILLTVGVWGGRWLSPDGAIFDFVDPVTGELVEPILCDRRTGRELGSGSVALKTGPGASEHLRAALPCPLVFGAKEVQV